MRWLMVVTLVVTAASAQASSFGTQASKLRLLEVDYHPATPVPRPPRVVPPVIDPVAPVVAATRFSLIPLGLGLVAGGLVLGGAGFALLYVCREGTGCYNNTTTIAGWVLAAPGIIPLVVGVAILYFGTGGGRRGELLPKEEAGQWAISAMPLSGGGLVSGAVRF